MNNDSLQLQAIQEITEQLISVRSPESASESFPGMKDQIVWLITRLRSAMFPQVFVVSTRRQGASTAISVSYDLQMAADLLTQMLNSIVPNGENNATLVLQFLQSLPEIKACLETDIQAAYEGDPAARTTEEIMLAYPAFEAISIHRMAHRLYELQIPLLPRMMSEYAHQLTGIDIHPGATIGRYFFIDHGTGVVIGETTTIGDHVKLYQGVTLGAKSFELDENGNPVKGIKRHPDLGSHVIVYAGATILGGNTRIGDGCTIGGNVWLTHSVESGKTVVAAEERALKIF